jgi:hypothetical protein
VIAALIAATAAACLSIWTARKPIPPFWIVLFVLCVLYGRTRLSLLGGGGFEDYQAGAAFGDFLWLGLLIGCLVRYRRMILRKSFLFSGRWALLLLLPFLGIIVLFPIAGVVTGGWPVSYVVPGLRWWQWASFGLIAFLLVKEHGAHEMLRSFIIFLVAVCGIHALYASIQHATFLGALPRYALILDDLYAEGARATWFYYPRVTGLLINPNSLGMLAAMAAVAFAAVVWTDRKAVPAGWALLGLPLSIVLVLFSGSRAGMLAVAVGLIATTLIAKMRGRFSVKEVVSTPAIVMGLVVSAAISLAVLPAILSERLDRFILAFRMGAEADVNFTGRIRRWTESLDAGALEYPLGTLVPASYALREAIDSFYVHSYVQGGAPQLLAWLGFLTGVIAYGVRGLRVGEGTRGPWGLMVLGFALVIAAGSIAGSPILQPQISVLLWVGVGAVAAEVALDRENTPLPVGAPARFPVSTPQQSDGRSE